MLSRVAETIYWIARMMERAENTARLVEANSFLIYDLPKDIPMGWDPLITVTESWDTFNKIYTESSEINCIHFLLNCEDNPNSIISSLNQARENMRTVRDVLPRKSWEQLNELYLTMSKSFPRTLSRTIRDGYVRATQSGCQEHVGILEGSLSRNHVYDFFLVGRNIERADMVSRILDIRAQEQSKDFGELAVSLKQARWASVLQSLNGYQMFRIRTRKAIGRESVVQFLLKDKTFPRSLTMCMNQVKESLRHYSKDTPAITQVNRIQSLLKVRRINHVPAQELSGYLIKIRDQLSLLHEEIGNEFFYPN